MQSFSITSGGSTTFVDTTPDGGVIIDFMTIDNSFNVQVNGVDVFVGGPALAPNELEFQINGTAGQTVRFADGDEYVTDTPEIWQLQNTNSEPILRMRIDPDGNVELFGVKENNGQLFELELFNGLSVNTAAIAAAWNTTGSNTIVVDQIVQGPTGATGDFVDVVCFAAGTLIETDKGLVRVETLNVSDNVLTYDHGYQPISWIGSCRLSRSQLLAHPKLKPILIQANALGAGYPKQDLVVSPQHRLLVSSSIATRMFDSKEVLIPANKLLSVDGIDVLEDNPHGIEYWHILFDQHEIIWSNGAPTESLYTGPQALRSISAKGRAEIQSLFPEICDPEFDPPTARYIPSKGRLMKKLVERHTMNGRPLYL